MKKFFIFLAFITCCCFGIAGLSFSLLYKDKLDKELLKFLKTGKSSLVDGSQDECFQEDEYPTDQIYKQRKKDLVENYKHQRTKRKVGIVFAKIALVLLYAIAGFVGIVIVASWFL